jgi:hypothetical protein
MFTLYNLGHGSANQPAKQSFTSHLEHCKSYYHNNSVLTMWSLHYCCVVIFAVCFFLLYVSSELIRVVAVLLKAKHAFMTTDVIVM